MSPTQNARRKHIATTVGALIMVLMLAGAGILVRQFIVTEVEDTAETVTLDTAGPAADHLTRSTPERGVNPRVRFTPPRVAVSRDVPTGITKSIGGVIRARRGDAFIRADADSRGKYRFWMEYVLSVRQSWASAEQNDLSYLGANILKYPKMAQHIGLKPEQRQQLADLPPADLKLTSAEEQRLAPLISAWDKAASGPAKETAAEQLLAAVAEIGAAHLQSTRDNVLNRVASIPKILTPQQIKLAQQWLAHPTDSPAMRPGN